MRSCHRLTPLIFLLATAGCSIAHTPIGELAEMFTMGHERLVHKPLRPIRGGTRVLIFALDGAGRDAFYGAIRAGRMPHVSQLLGPDRGGGVFAHGYEAPDVLSILPSTTIPAWSSIFTGRPPAQTGVTGNEWFSRGETAFHAPVPMTVKSRSDAVKLYTDELLSKLLKVPTLYEQLPPVRMHVSASPVFRGADVLSFPDLAQFGDLFGAILGETLAGNLKRSARVARESDESSVGSLIQSISHHGVPDVQTVYFNGIDMMTHYAEHPLEDQQRYLQTVTDTMIGKVLDVYRREGALAQTYVLFIADHGHTPVLPDDRHSLTTAGDDEPPAILEQVGFRVRQFDLSPDEQDYQATVAYQGFTAYVYLADRSTCTAAGERCDWSRPPRLNEDVLPVVRAFYNASESGGGVPGMKGAIDLIFVRVPTEYGGVASVQVYDGKALIPIPEYLRRHPRPDLLRLQQRMTELMIGPYGNYAGDIVLLARAGLERPIENRFYFGDPETSEHGSASAQDSRVPLLLAHPLHTGEELRRVVREALGAEASQLDFVPLVQDLVAEPVVKQ